MHTINPSFGLDFPSAVYFLQPPVFGFLQPQAGSVSCSCKATAKTSNLVKAPASILRAVALQLPGGVSGPDYQVWTRVLVLVGARSGLFP